MIHMHPATRKKAPAPQPGPQATLCRVAVLVDSSDAVGRGILAGVRRAARAAEWSLDIEPARLGEMPPPWFRRWDGDGVIVRLASPRAAEAIARRSLPVVDVAGSVSGGALPRVRFDDVAIGRMAATHLVERGLPSVAFCGIADVDWSRDRERGVIAAAGRLVHADPFHLESGQSGRTAPSTLVGRIAVWLAALPRPVGVVACDDIHAAMVLDACRLAGLDVPNAVAVVGAGDDQSMCKAADPPLSSVMVDAARAGELATGLLGRLLDGRGRPADRDVVVPPLRVEVRRSSDVFAIDDPHVAAVLRLVRGGELRHQRVAKLVAASGLPRRSLLRRFQESLGHSLHEELIRARVARAERLLVDTDLPIAEVASRAGFNYPEYLGRVFRQRHGCSPREFRRAGGGRGRSA